LPLSPPDPIRRRQPKRSPGAARGLLQAPAIGRSYPRHSDNRSGRCGLRCIRVRQVPAEGLPRFERQYRLTRSNWSENRSPASPAAARPPQAASIGPIAHQQARFDHLTAETTRRYPIARRKRRKLDTPAVEEPIAGNEEGICPVAHEGGERRLNF